MINLADIKAKAEAATGGEWEAKDNSNIPSSHFRATICCELGQIASLELSLLKKHNGYETLLANAEYIAAANPATILELVQEVEANRWVSVDERLPEDPRPPLRYGNYLCILRGNLGHYPEVMQYYGEGSWCHGLNNSFKNVTHWKPILPPKGAG